MGVQFEIDFDRTLAAMIYIASQRPRNLDTYKMCKLVFLSDKLHLVRFGRTITGDKIRAMEYGPVPSWVYDYLKNFIAGVDDDVKLQTGRRFLVVDKSFSYPHFETTENTFSFEEYLSPSDIEALGEVVALHGHKSFEELKSLTHEMASWQSAWNDPERTSKSPVMSFEELFVDDADAVNGASEEMIENFDLRRAFHERTPF